MIYPLVRELAEDGIPVTVTCRVLKFSPQGYYKWLKRPVTKRDFDNAYLTNQLYDAHHDDPPFGYRFLADELERLGECASERRVWRLCSDMAIWSSFVKKSRSGKKPGPPVHDDLVQRDFSAATMNELWFTDLTEHMTGEGKVYLCSLEDAFSSRIVGYSIGERMTSDLCVSALQNAIRLRDPKGTVVHSDRGSQGEFKRSSQHFDLGGVYGKTSRMDEGTDGPFADEVAGTSGLSARGGVCVLARDRHGNHERSCGGRCWRGAGGGNSLVPASWWNAPTHSRITNRPLPLL
jgi:putative transposase